jgi:putative endonuclease
MSEMNLAVRTPAQQLGDAAEATVAGLLVGSGWTVVGRNLRFGRNEVDILAVDPAPPASLVIVEVRWRANRQYGLGEETFDWRKRAHLRAAVGRLHEVTALADGTSIPRLPIRIDLVVVEPSTSGDHEGPLRIRHHRDALAS